MAEKKSLGIGIYRKQQLEAEVIRACRSCGAPGFYHDVPDVNLGCFDPSRKGQYVGEICPNCDSERARPERKGVIWSKHFYPASTPKWLLRGLEWINGR
jgi:hypothetical protein